jgi:hypothetical protein
MRLIALRSGSAAVLISVAFGTGIGAAALRLSAGVGPERSKVLEFQPLSLAPTADGAWVAGIGQRGHLVQFDATLRARQRMTLNGIPWLVAAHGQRVWVVTAALGTSGDHDVRLKRVNRGLTTGVAIPGPGRPLGIAATDDSLWVVRGGGDVTTISLFDSSGRFRRVGRIKGAVAGATFLAADARGAAIAYKAPAGRYALARYRTDGSKGSVIHLSGVPRAIAAGGGYYWVATSTPSGATSRTSVWKVAAQPRRVFTLGPLTALAWSRGNLLSLSQSGVLRRFAPRVGHSVVVGSVGGTPSLMVATTRIWLLDPNHRSIRSRDLPSP